MVRRLVARIMRCDAMHLWQTPPLRGRGRIMRMTIAEVEADEERNDLWKVIGPGVVAVGVFRTSRHAIERSVPKVNCAADRNAGTVRHALMTMMASVTLIAVCWHLEVVRAAAHRHTLVHQRAPPRSRLPTNGSRLPAFQLYITGLRRGH